MIWPAVIAGIAAVIAATLGILNRQKIGEIHVLVNSRLDEALGEIRQLKKQVRFEQTQQPTEEDQTDERSDDSSS